jgi:23S rRNA (uridine2552-2'-O)-methyltransferase
VPGGSGYPRKDALYRRAKREGLRSRAAYKLEELQRSHGFLRSGQRVADLGCWPGGWLQVAADRVGPTGRVVGIDLAPIDPPLPHANVIAWSADLTQPGVEQALLDALGGLADVVLCDAAPKLTGVRPTDRAREEALLETVAALVPKLLRPGGTLVLKLLEGPEAVAIATQLGRRFRSARTTRLRATRSGSSEKYLVAQGLLGP